MSLSVLLLSLGQIAAAQVPGFEEVPVRVAPSQAALEPQATWTSADYATAASTLPSDLLDRKLLYLHRAATLTLIGTGDDFDHWLSYGRTLVELASANPPYPLTEDDSLMQRLAADALGNAARGFLRQCPLHSDCAKTRALARDVLAELVVHCDNADGALWDRCPEDYLSPLRTTPLPEWPPDDMARRPSYKDLPCDVARRSWPELTPEAFEREYNEPGLPVIVSNLTDGWPAKAWTEPTGNENWVYLRTAQSIVRSLMRRAHDLPPYDPRQPEGSSASLFGVPQFRGGTLDNQYINRALQAFELETSAARAP